MTDKELKKLSRAELLEMLIEQSKRADELQAKLDKAEEELNSRQLKVDEAGSIAEAAIKVSGIFDAAQQASARYLESIEVLASQKERDALRAQQILEETQTKCAAMWEETQNQCKKMVEKAKRDSMDYWVKVSKKVDKQN